MSGSNATTCGVPTTQDAQAKLAARSQGPRSTGHRGGRHSARRRRRPGSRPCPRRQPAKATPPPSARPAGRHRRAQTPGRSRGRRPPPPRRARRPAPATRPRGDPNSALLGHRARLDGQAAGSAWRAEPQAGRTPREPRQRAAPARAAAAAGGQAASRPQANRAGPRRAARRGRRTRSALSGAGGGRRQGACLARPAQSGSVRQIMMAGRRRCASWRGWGWRRRSRRC